MAKATFYFYTNLLVNCKMDATIQHVITFKLDAGRLVLENGGAGDKVASAQEKSISPENSSSFANEVTRVKASFISQSGKGPDY